MSVEKDADPRRWLALLAYMGITLMCEVQWLAHASVARAAEAFYAGQFDSASVLNIDFLAMLYMVVYLVLSLPASRLIDSGGLRKGVGLGALLAMVGAIIKALGAHSFILQVLGQIALAASQPFLINAATALSARWFPLRERGLATGLASLAQYLGFVVALGLTPLMVSTDPASASYGAGMNTALLAYGIGTVLMGIFALLFVSDGPQFGARVAERATEKTRSPRLLDVFAPRDMKLTFFLFLIGLGVMNALTSMTDSVAGSIGAKDSDGLIGVFMILGGVIGAVLLPALSDKMRKRKPFIVLCAALMVPGMLGLALVGRINPYSYKWSLVEAPAGSELSIRERIPHPSFRATVPGEYRFSFELAKGGTATERKTLVVMVSPGAEPEATASDTPVLGDELRKVVPGQTVLLDGTTTDDGVIDLIYILALAASFVFGFAVMSAGPLGFQYAAEVSSPAPEAVSQGTLLLAGQLSGILFTAGMSVKQNAYLGGFLALFAGLAVLMLLLTIPLRESPLIVTEEEKYREA